MVEWLTLLLGIQEVLGSNVSLGTSYPDWSFCGFIESLEANAEIEPWNKAWTALISIFLAFDKESLCISRMT
jgi:hypothetical protein